MKDALQTDVQQADAQSTIAVPRIIIMQHSLSRTKLRSAMHKHVSPVITNVEFEGRCITSCDGLL